jgi:spore coat-associated protein N
MSRLEILIKRPKRTLAVLAVVLAAVGIAIGSGATFTATAANPGNTFASGTLSIGNTPSGAILTASNMKPGDVATGTVDIQNTGTLTGTFIVRRSALTNSDSTNPMSDKLDLLIEDCGDFASGTPSCDPADPDIYSGTLTAMTGTYSLGSFPGNGTTGKHRYKFTVTFNSSAGNQYQGDDSTAEFTWDATQS